MLVINDTHGRYPENNKRHPGNKRHSGHLREKTIKDTQSIKRHSGHCRDGRGGLFSEFAYIWEGEGYGCESISERFS